MLVQWIVSNNILPFQEISSNGLDVVARLGTFNFY